jgi:long-chain acyl-CoA synthetase
MTMTLHHLIARHARYRGDLPAVQFEAQQLNWREFDIYCNQIANAFQAAGLRKGGKIATVLPNTLELLALYWAITSLGAIVIPLSPLLNPVGIIKLLKTCEAFGVVVSPAHEAELSIALSELNTRLLIVNKEKTENSFAEFVKDAPGTPVESADISPDDLFNIVYSSGTTGEPKGIEHSHLVRAQYGAHFAAAFRMTPESVVLHTGSIVFNGAFCTLMPAFFLGAKYILHKAFNVEHMLATIRDERVTHAMMVPAQIIALLEHPDLNASDLESLEMVLSLGAPLYQQHKDRFNTLLPGRLYELYGLTEGFITVLDKFDMARKSGSVGSPLPGFEMRIVDDHGNNPGAGKVGEIVGSGPLTMSGYYQRPDLTAKTISEGWIYTGDLGYIDEDGFLFLVDRKKDMIISGGVNVYPRDIENVVIDHPDVVETAVFGANSDQWGETPVAAVTLRTNCQIDKTELIEWVNQRVDAKYQRISDIIILNEFPRNAAGKTLKTSLRDDYHATK